MFLRPSVDPDKFAVCPLCSAPFYKADVQSYRDMIPAGERAVNVKCSKCKLQHNIVMKSNGFLQIFSE